jgi:hypothetical protein
MILGPCQYNNLNRTLQPRSHLRRRNRLGTRSPKARGNHQERKSLLMQTRHPHPRADLQKRRQATRGVLKMVTIHGLSLPKILNRVHLLRNHTERKGNHQGSGGRQQTINRLERLRLLAMRRHHLQSKRRFHPHKVTRVMRRRKLRLITILSASSPGVHNE